MLGIGSVFGWVFGKAAGAGLSFVGGWVMHGTASAMRSVAALISSVTAPQLTSAWFSAEYWRVTEVATLLTVPFLFAAAIQALVRSEPALLLRSALGYLPLALIGVGIAAPLAMLLLAATDEMCAMVSGPGVSGGAAFVNHVAELATTVTASGASAFFAVFLGVVLIAVAVVLMLELLIRDAAVYIVVLMLPLAFTALVWPARRVWAVRIVELLIALILSKFVIVAVLALAGSALGSSVAHGPAALLPAIALLSLSAFAPWGMLRMLPFTEIAAGASGALTGQLSGRLQTVTGHMERHLGPRDLPSLDRGGAGDGPEPAHDPTTPPAGAGGTASRTGGGHVTPGASGGDVGLLGPAGSRELGPGSPDEPGSPAEAGAALAGDTVPAGPSRPASELSWPHLYDTGEAVPKTGPGDVPIDRSWIDRSSDGTLAAGDPPMPPAGEDRGFDSADGDADA